MTSKLSLGRIPVFANGRITATTLTFSPSLSFTTFNTMPSNSHYEYSSRHRHHVGRRGNNTQRGKVNVIHNYYVYYVKYVQTKFKFDTYEQYIYSVQHCKKYIQEI